MRLISAFLHLVRWPNLVFIAITQSLFNYAVVFPLFHQEGLTPNLLNNNFILLCTASLLIAGAGYIINDYFDINIDQINKPQKMVVDKIIKRRWAIFWHMIMSAIGVTLSYIVSFFMGDKYFLIGNANLICVILLWLYSTTYKKKILIGNIIISLLTAWTVLVIYTAQIPYWWQPFNKYAQPLTKLFRVAVLYGGFAFIISLIREVVKDIEDMDGDRKEGCRTMPIVWGVPASKLFCAVWLMVLIGVLIVIQFYVIQFDWWFSAVYALVAIILPLIYIFRKLYYAQYVSDYARLSKWIKIVMLSGILSMIFFWFYLR